MRRSQGASSYRVFNVETSFQTKTAKSGGIDRSAAIVAAQNSLREMQSSIESTLDEKLADLEKLFAQTDSGDNDLKGKIDSMHDLASILRDLGGVVEFGLITYVSESLCKFLRLFEARGGFEKAIVDCHLKTIRLVRGETYRRLNIGDVPQLKAGFDDMLRKIAALHSY
ncbi:MAG: hypothetical protein AB7O50_16700 [Pseudolabrys sp.]